MDSEAYSCSRYVKRLDASISDDVTIIPHVLLYVLEVGRQLGVETYRWWQQKNKQGDVGGSCDDVRVNVTIAAWKAIQTFIVQSQCDEVRSTKTFSPPAFVFLPPYLIGLVPISLFPLVNLSLCRSLTLSQFVCYRPDISPVLLSVTEPLPNQLRHIISQECRMPRKTSKERLHTSLKLLECRSPLDEANGTSSSA